ncbi:MAG: hypothetical protein CBARDCOR_4209 [uncultured Caballeronia sp.]|nr:MAG: hypothetical protein CBARDCOR_4209 [uncultured Caballeronia sp.]
MVRSRRLPDPTVLGNAGSFFINLTIKTFHFEKLARFYSEIPRYFQSEEYIKTSTGCLIEQCGFHGIKFGGVGVYKDNPLVILNYGKATFEEIRNSLAILQKSVKERFSISLKRKPVLVDW